MSTAQAVRRAGYLVLIATGVVVGAEVIRGWIALVLVIAGVASVVGADRLEKKTSARRPA
ncbi:MAG: hypothetical protein M3N47_12615 [Chloroflexota bacterium]|nr:hypothetical protein [Chloroflexota bacterium]